jgi:hypothetical protein
MHVRRVWRLRAPAIALSLGPNTRAKLEDVAAQDGMCCSCEILSPFDSIKRLRAKGSEISLLRRRASP